MGGAEGATILESDKVITSGHFFGGSDAIKKVEAIEGELTDAQKRVVELEGYVDTPYYDTKGIVTSGVGQTGEFIKKGFKASYKEHEDRAEDKIPSLKTLPEELQAELIQAEYRGDLGLSPKAVRLFNSGDYIGAASEFLSNDEYLNANTPKQIKDRMKAVADAMITYDNNRGSK